MFYGSETHIATITGRAVRTSVYIIMTKYALPRYVILMCTICPRPLSASVQDRSPPGHTENFKIGDYCWTISALRVKGK